MVSEIAETDRGMGMDENKDQSEGEASKGDDPRVKEMENP